jgi:hypothetical protein
MNDIKLSQWYLYLKCIYDDDQLKDKLPFSMNDFWIIQTNLLPTTIKLDTPTKSPTGYHSLFTTLDSHVSSQKNVIYIYQYNIIPTTWANSPPDPKFKLKDGITSNTWIEISRGADKLGGYTWFYYMPGTGNWFNLGKTISFYDHHEAFDVAKKNGVYIKDPIDGVGEDQTAMGTYFKSIGYDTIQFTCRSEGKFKYEIFNLKNKQEIEDDPCVSGIITRAKQKCQCTSSKKYLNCSVSNDCHTKTLPAI